MKCFYRYKTQEERKGQLIATEKASHGRGSNEAET